MSRRTLSLGSLLVLASSAALSQTVIETPNPAPKGKDPNRIICETIERIGSRLQKDRVCLTAQQWKDHQAGHRADLEKVQQVVNQNPSR